MCNHYRNNPDGLAQIPLWRDYVAQLHLGDAMADMWPGRTGIVAMMRDGAKSAALMSWGISLTVAGKRPGTHVKKRVTNVRNLQSAFWRPMLTHASQRCLVPFTEFAEPDGRPNRGETWFRVMTEDVAAFAGIWRPPTGDGAMAEFAFLTCEPNPLVGAIHPKAMPVILHPQDYDKWLSGAPAQELAVPFPSQLMVSAEG